MKTTLKNDGLLIADYIKGDENALEKLINKYAQRLYGFIYSKVFDREVTEDIFQDTFIKVINTLKNGRYNEEGKFLPWIMRIAHNLIIDYYRKNSKIPKYESNSDFDIFSVLSDSGLNVEDKMIKDQVVIDVKRLIDNLPDEQKEVLEMRIYRDMSFKEISEVTNVSINTALGRMRYALINLKKMIEKKDANSRI